jgi:hypothetical protein
LKEISYQYISMKKFLLVLQLFIVTYPIFGQELNLDELISLRGQGLASVEEYLTNKGWQFLNSKEPEPKGFGELKFSYGQHKYDERADAFFTYYYKPNDLKTNQIIYKIEEPSVYLSLVNRAKGLGYTLNNSTIIGKQFVKIYEKDTSVIYFITESEKDGIGNKPVYEIQFLHSSTYKQ